MGKPEARTLEVKMLLARFYIRGYSKLHGGGRRWGKEMEGGKSFLLRERWIRKRKQINRHPSR